MKKLILVIAFLVFSSSVANATLINRGTDSLGNRLIYDDILDITWYDLLKPTKFMAGSNGLGKFIIGGLWWYAP